MSHSFCRALLRAFCLAVALVSTPLHAQEDVQSQLNQIQASLRQIKTDYEQRIANLEQQVQQLQRENVQLANQTRSNNAPPKAVAATTITGTGALAKPVNTGKTPQAIAKTESVEAAITAVAPPPIISARGDARGAGSARHHRPRCRRGGPRTRPASSFRRTHRSTRSGCSR